MGTSATIIFKDEYEDKFFVNRGHDGFPDVVMPHLLEVIERKKGAWSGSEIGLFVSSFISLFTDNEEMFPDYALAQGVRGDDSYQYYVFYNKELDAWEANYAISYSIKKTEEKLSEKHKIVCQSCFFEMECSKEKEYYCKHCDSMKVVSNDTYEFKINEEYSNIFFKIGV